VNGTIRESHSTGESFLIGADGRPYLLRRKPQDGRYAYSRNAAIESATADLLGRRAFVMEKGDLIVNSGGYRV
jgi:hypothetical protein